jgi:diguanylate cyclase (GGDEF)-like protein
MGPLVLYASAPLLMHTLLYRFGVPDPEFGALREGVALIATVILTGMTLVYHRLVQQENRRLAAEELMAREQLAHRAFHDELTGLPNRNLFMDRLRMAIAEAVRTEQSCAVLFCDLDQFKVINDSLGHEAGDETLIYTARRLCSTVRERDTVARLGGDEFAVVLTGIGNPQDAAHLAKKMLEALGEPLCLAGKHHSLTASIGIAVYPDDGITAKALLKHADTAMYQSKIHGRNTFRLFTEAMNVAAEERLSIEQGLRAGLIAEQFSVFYQPIVSLDTGRAAGYEALVRWYDPQRGYITPASFIDVAEQTGLIVPIGQWVLETACAWAAEHPVIKGWPPTMSVNISARQLREPGVVDYVADVLARTGLEPACLQLEITESVALSMEASSGVLPGLRRLGVRIAIDDFGTGHSALSRLQEMPVDAVKIDRCFVQGIEENSVSEAIVTAIVSMADAMGITVVAEGVETASELAVIRQARCHAAQGYYYCEPLPAEALAEKFSNGHTDGVLVFVD